MTMTHPLTTYSVNMRETVYNCLTLKELCILSRMDKQIRVFIIQYFNRLAVPVANLQECRPLVDLSNLTTDQKKLLRLLHPRSRIALLYNHGNTAYLTKAIASQIVIDVARQLPDCQLGILHKSGELKQNVKVLTHVLPWVVKFLIQMPELQRGWAVQAATKRSDAMGDFFKDRDMPWILLGTGNISSMARGSAIHSASIRGNLPLVEFLFTTGEISDEDRGYSVQDAAKWSFSNPRKEKQKEVIQLLLRSGSISRIARDQALEYAKRHRREDIVALLS